MYPPDKATLEAENVEATSMGAKTNLNRHTHPKHASFGVPVVVSINRFASDTDAELAAITQAAHESGASAVCITEVHAKGGEGGKDLAEAVVKAVQNHVATGRPFVPLFTPKTDVLDKAEAIAKRLYKADGLELTAKANRELFDRSLVGLRASPRLHGEDPVLLFSDPGLLGAPTSCRPGSQFRLNAGAGFVVAVLGDMMTMPVCPSARLRLTWTWMKTGTSSACLGEGMDVLGRDHHEWRLRVQTVDDLWVDRLVQPGMSVGMLGERRDQTTGGDEVVVKTG